MIILYENNLFKNYFEIIAKDIEYNQNLEYYKNLALMQLDNIWSEFYSDFINYNKYSDANLLFNTQ